MSINLFFCATQALFSTTKGLSVRIFGVSFETRKTQINYLLPEGHYRDEDRGKGKGSNLAINFIYIFWRTNNDSKHIRLHADNCGGQNKNQYVFYYFIWLVIIGKLNSVDLSFMITGHTKSVVDALFGLLKSALQLFYFWTMDDLSRAVEIKHKTL